MFFCWVDQNRGMNCFVYVNLFFNSRKQGFSCRRSIFLFFFVLTILLDAGRQEKEVIGRKRVM